LKRKKLGQCFEHIGFERDPVGGCSCSRSDKTQGERRLELVSDGSTDSESFLLSGRQEEIENGHVVLREGRRVTQSRRERFKLSPKRWQS